MKELLERLEYSVLQLKCLDEVFMKENLVYSQMHARMVEVLGDDYAEFKRELYAGGKKKGELQRQMILGDVIEYVFSGRAYYHAAKSRDKFRQFAALLLSCVNQLLILDSITVDPEVRTLYIESLEAKIDPVILYEKDGDRDLAAELKQSQVVYSVQDWDRFDALVDSLLPKTLGTPKELVVFLELIRLNIGLVVPMLLTQRLFGDGDAIAPPDFLLLRKNKEIFGIELGYSKEGQSREFSIRTSIPTFGVDLSDHLHNRCPKCGKFILYCPSVIRWYSEEVLHSKLNKDMKVHCSYKGAGALETICESAVYYGKYNGNCYYGEQKPGDAEKFLHYHAKCVVGDSYFYRNRPKNISDHVDEFYCQIPRIEGIEKIVSQLHGTVE